MSGARNGTAARTLTGAKTIWASFHFAAKPKGKLTLTWYKLGKKRVRLGATSKDPATKVVSYIKSAARSRAPTRRCSAARASSSPRSRSRPNSPDPALKRRAPTASVLA